MTAVGDEVGDDARSVLGLSVRANREEPLGDVHAWGFEHRNDERGVIIGWEDKHRRSLERHRLVAGEPGQISTDRQQESLDRELALTGADAFGSFEPGLEKLGVHAGTVAAIDPVTAWRAW